MLQFILIKLLNGYVVKVWLLLWKFCFIFNKLKLCNYFDKVFFFKMNKKCVLFYDKCIFCYFFYFNVYYVDEKKIICLGKYK